MPSPEQSRLNGKKRLPGSKWKRTLEKEAIRELIKRKITPELEPMLDAQIAHAKGIKYLVTRNAKTGKFTRVGEAMAKNADEETVEVWEKDPSIEALKVLLDRTVDKPKEQAQDLNVQVTDVAKILAEGRQRAAARNKKEPM